jgi:hypothetical protein
MGRYKNLSNTLIFKIAHPWHWYSTSFFLFNLVYFILKILFWTRDLHSRLFIHEDQLPCYGYYNCDSGLWTNIHWLDDLTRTGWSIPSLAVCHLSAEYLLPWSVTTSYYTNISAANHILKQIFISLVGVDQWNAIITMYFVQFELPVTQCQETYNCHYHYH